MQLDFEVVQRPASHRDKPGGVLQQAVTLRDFSYGTSTRVGPAAFSLLVPPSVIQSLSN